MKKRERLNGNNKNRDSFLFNSKSGKFETFYKKTFFLRTPLS